MYRNPSGLRVEKIRTVSSNHIYVKTASMLLHDEVTPKAMHKSISRLRLPLKYCCGSGIQSMPVPCFVFIYVTLNCSCANDELIDDASLQIRSWEGSNTSKPALAALFGTQIDSILEKNAQQTFYLATDLLKVKSELKGKYRAQIKFIDTNNCTNRSKRCVSLAAAEL